ncbi:right-handed parallel beta-helix repeat-containing protein [Pedobacter psychroterrae]|nr:right-handed parallel beta-helix repeat-containing protein [Pedobacter psychroterrae]
MMCLLAVAFGCYAQSDGYVYKPVPAEYLERKIPSSLVQKADQLKRRAFPIESVLPINYVTDGTIDYTRYVQAAMDAHLIVLMPDFPVLVNDSGLNVRTGQSIIFNTLSKIVLVPSRLNTYEILRVHNADNVFIYQPVITGDKGKHLDTLGQWGMGIAIRASENVVLVKPQISKCWGDGIYIGQLNKKPARNITIIEPLLDDNRRNGLSVTAVNGLKIIGGVISNSNGQNPKSGIDIEPNHNHDVIDSITISETVTFNHASYGIVISLQHLLGRASGKSNITLIKTIDDSSGIGLGIIGKPLDGVLDGRIRISGPALLNNRKMPIRLPLRPFGLKVELSGLMIETPFKYYKTDRIKAILKKKHNIIVQ